MSSGPNDPAHDDWPAEDGDATLVGTTGGAGGAAGAMPVYFDQQTGSFFGATMDESTGNIERLSDHSWDLNPEESIGEGIERLGDELGWESLSQFAEEHLESDDG